MSPRQRFGGVDEHQQLVAQTQCGGGQRAGQLAHHDDPAARLDGESHRRLVNRVEHIALVHGGILLDVVSTAPWWNGGALTTAVAVAFRSSRAWGYRDLSAGVTGRSEIASGSWS